ncbi:MAG: M48 family metallopeptidase [Desulfitobacterium sp.]|nr:M48 family metallopeptidase [Desulfitobacterium sp.]
MSSLRLGDTVIPYEERKNSRIKRLSIRVTPEKVRVSAPVSTSREEIQIFLQQNQEWILENWGKLQKIARESKREYLTGEKVPYLGKELTLQICDSQGKMIRAIYNIEEESLEISIPQSFTQELREEAVREILEKWYKEKARPYFLQKLSYWSREMGVSYNKFRLKGQKTRWGSCSTLGNINLNWRLIMAPEPVIDYIVIHELSHLIYMDHSKEFWKHVARFCPNYREHRHWLRKNGHTLVI